MAQVVLSTAAQAHDDAAALTEESRHEAVATLQASERGSLPREIWSCGQRRPNWSAS